MIYRNYTDEQLKIIAQTFPTENITSGIKNIFSTELVRVNKPDKKKDAARSFFRLPTKLRNLAPYLNDITDDSIHKVASDTNQLVRKTGDTRYKYNTILCEDGKINHLSGQSKRTLNKNYKLFSQEKLHEACGLYKEAAGVINYYYKNGISPEDAIADINKYDLADYTTISEVNINYSNILKQIHKFKVFEWNPEFKDYSARKKKMVELDEHTWSDLPKNIDYGTFFTLDFITMEQLELILSEATPFVDKEYSSVRSDVFRVIFGAKYAKHVKEALDSLDILKLYRRPILGFRSSLFKPKFKFVNRLEATSYQVGRMILFKKYSPKFTRVEQSILLELYASNINSSSKGVLAKFKNRTSVESLKSIKSDLDYMIMVLGAVNEYKIQAASHARYISSHLFYGINNIISEKTNIYQKYWVYTSKQEKAFAAWDKLVNTGIDFLDDKVHQSEVDFSRIDITVSTARAILDTEDTNLTDLELYKSVLLIKIPGLFELRAIIRHFNRQDQKACYLIDIETVQDYINSPEIFKKIVVENKLNEDEEYGKLLRLSA